MVISILSTEYLRNYRIKLCFSDNTVQEISFFEFLNNSGNPMTSNYLNEEEFKNFSLEYGDIIWNDYEMCFPVWDLYTDQI